MPLTVTIDDPNGELADLHGRIEETILTAWQDWTSSVLSADASIELTLRVTTEVLRAAGNSSLAQAISGSAFVQQGVTVEILTGTDLNGAEPDALIQLNPDYGRNELWYDPNPGLQVDPVPIDRTDAVSVWRHEFGHVLSINGFLDNQGDPVQPGVLSTFDQFVQTDSNGNVFFLGPQTLAENGGGVAITADNAYHLGNQPPLPGAALITDLMNGVSFERGLRYQISDLDKAIAFDTGLPVDLMTDDTVLGNDSAELLFGGGGNDTVFGGSGGDTVMAGSGNDQVLGNADSDQIFGGDGFDSLRGSRGNDFLQGNKNGDSLNGGTGNDEVRGGAGLDTLRGARQDDTLIGGRGADSLNGGLGDDLLVGGEGSDAFIFDQTGGQVESLLNPGTFLSGGSGQDRIMDFGPGNDVIQVSANVNGLALVSLGDLLARLSPNGDGNARLDLGPNDSVIFQGVSVSELGAGDFLIV